MVSATIVIQETIRGNTFLNFGDIVAIGSPFILIIFKRKIIVIIGIHWTFSNELFVKGVKWICNSSEEAFKRLEDQAIKVTCLYGLEVESDVWNLFQKHGILKRLLWFRVGTLLTTQGDCIKYAIGECLICLCLHGGEVDLNMNHISKVSIHESPS